jgi:hypothetical protein
VREPRVDQVDVFVLGRLQLAERDRERALGRLGLENTNVDVR